MSLQFIVFGDQDRSTGQENCWNLYSSCMLITWYSVSSSYSSHGI